jgi:hypothetical protein
VLRGALGLGAFVLTGCSDATADAVASPSSDRPDRPDRPTTREPSADAVEASVSDPADVAPGPRGDTPPAPSPKPVPEKSRGERILLEGTPAATRITWAWSGTEGPVLMVLGGVHGNEPGGWFAAGEVATWEPANGGLVVVPQANRIAAAAFVRTTDDLGDLNRLYPGSADGATLMERMAAELVAAAKEFGAGVILDLHESWAFYAERSQNGTAFLGQTVSAGIGPRNPGLARGVVERVNDGITRQRDLLIERDGAPFRRDTDSNGAAPAGRGRSSLSLGGYVEGLTPILVEMGQQDQLVARRTALHLEVVRATMALLGMV